MTTTVWLFEPRSHGRKKEVARARNGAPLPGRLPSFHMPHRSASSALCPCGHAASFRRRASSFVGRPVCKSPERGARVPVCKAARGGHRQACVCGWPARVQAPRAGGTGARVQGRSRRPQAGAAWAVVARCVRGTSSRSASAACGVRGVRAAQQKGSWQCDSAEQVVVSVVAWENNTIVLSPAQIKVTVSMSLSESECISDSNGKLDSTGPLA